MESNLKSDEFSLRRNLFDAGCDEETVNSIVEIHQAGNTDRETVLLNRVRRDLLEKLHAEQRRIDCLDFLLNRLNLNKTTRTGGKK